MPSRYGKRRKYKPSTYRKRRFSRKKFTKYPNKQRNFISANVLARETFVKLPFYRTIQNISLAASSSVSYSFLGNSLIPYPAAYNTSTPTAGDLWTSGVFEYSNFYNFYRVLGSSIKVQFVAISANNVFRIAIIPVTYAGPESGTLGSVADRITELDALTYDQISMQPGAQTRTLGLATGGNASVVFKLFRKTKNMLASKDIRDNENTLARLPDNNGTNGTIVVNGNSAFFYYIRIFNAAAASVGTFEIAVRMKYYTQLSGRTNWSTLTAA